MEILLRTILLGVVNGSVYALAAIGLVLTYKISGILNFGYGALALFATYLHWQFTIEWGLPLWLSATLVIAIAAPLLGLFLDAALFRRIEGQPQVIGVIATVGLWVLLTGVIYLLWGPESRTIPSLFPRRTVPLVGGVKIGLDQIGVLAVAAASAAGLGAVLRYTHLGVTFRAVVDSRSVAALMGINAALVSGLAWALGTAFAAVTGILLTPRLFLDATYLPPFIIAFVLGAAVVGYLRSLPLAYLGGILLGVAESLVVQYGNFTGLLQNLVGALPFLTITVLLLAAPRSVRARDTGGASFVVRGRELATQAPAKARAVVATLVFGVLALVPVIASHSISWKLAVIIGMTYSIVFLSLVILTGYSGQISLGHTAFMGIGAFTAGHLVADLGLPMWAAFPLGALAAVPAGALVGVVAVRLHGLFLALMTLAFAFMAQALFFGERSVSGGEGGIPVPRPEGAQEETLFYYFVFAIFCACTLLAVNLRTGRTGRVLAALRDSETAARSLGIDVVRSKVLIFAISALLAGVAGVLLGMIQEQVNSRTFIPFNSLIYMTLAVLGGIFHVGGAIVAGLFYAIYPQVFGGIEMMNRLQYIFFGLGATLALARNPEGTFGELRRIGAALARRFERPAEPPGVPAPPAPAAAHGGSR